MIRSSGSISPVLARVFALALAGAGDHFFARDARCNGGRRNRMQDDLTQRSGGVGATSVGVDSVVPIIKTCAGTTGEEGQA